MMPTLKPPEDQKETDEPKPIKAEIWAVIKALAFAKSFGYDYIWVECDAMAVFHLLSTRSFPVSWSVFVAWTLALQFIDCDTIFCHLPNPRGIYQRHSDA